MKNKGVFRFSISAFLILALLVTLNPFSAKGAGAQTPKNEMRAVWISTVQNLDMKAGMTKAQYTAWARETLDQLKTDNFNAVIFQVKPTGDALYSSKLAPWSAYITGKAQGTNPGYDPLLIMTEEAHARGMELHAWINPYRVTMPNQTLTSLSADNVARKNPSWVVKYGSQYYLNPGLPEVQNYLVETVKELVANYDIDAVHMDDYFYPYKIAGQVFPDQEAFKKYGASFKNIEDWRRNNVNELVSKLYNAIKSTKPHVQYGISPFGVWRNKSVDPTGSDTRATSAYDDLYADTRQWIKDGSIDYITPQVYWSRTLNVASYTTLLKWWSNEVNTYAKVHPVNLYLGVADYKVGANSDTAWNNKMELPNQVIANRDNGTAKGQMHFSLRYLQKNALGYATVLKQQLYNYKAVTPAVAWKNSAQPLKPTSVKAVKDSSGIKLTISDQNTLKPRKYIIYRFDGSSAGSYQLPKNIVDVVYNTNGTTTYLDKTANVSNNYTYGIVSVSGTGVESKEATVVKYGTDSGSVPSPGTGSGSDSSLVSSFKDISSTFRAYKEIDYLAQGGITTGDTKGNFNPTKQVTRAEAAAMIGRTLALDGTKRSTKFKDVGPSIFASGYIQSAVEKGIISGYADGTFKPNANVTRGEMAIMISRAFNYNFGQSISGAAEALKVRGIAQGMADGSFGAGLPITRADFAVFLARAIDFNLRLGTPTFEFSGEKTINAQTVSVRKGPATSYAQVAVLNQNEKVIVGYAVGSWTLIKSSSGVVGFVLTSSLK